MPKAELQLRRNILVTKMRDETIKQNNKSSVERTYFFADRIQEEIRELDKQILGQWR